MLPASLVDPACEILESARPLLTDAILADLYANTFWKNRFDDYGRGFARVDTQYHLNYLITALRSDSRSIYPDYWVRYRLVMVQRGACTHHVHEFIDCTARQVGLVLREAFPLAEPHFAASHLALEYDLPACRALSGQRDAIIERVTQMVSPLDDELKSTRRDMRYHLSYLEDAAALERPELFTQYAQWVRQFLMEFGLRPAGLAGALQALDEALMQMLPAESAAVFTAMLRSVV